MTTVKRTSVSITPISYNIMISVLKDIHNSSVQFEVKEYGKITFFQFCSFLLQLSVNLSCSNFISFSSSQVLGEIECATLHPQNGYPDRNKHNSKVELARHEIPMSEYMILVVLCF